MIRTLLITIALLLNIFSCNFAHADVVDTMASILDKAPAGSLPFSGNDVRHYKTLIQSCESASNFDQVILCVDKASKDPQIGDGAEIPSWFPLMLDVYFDIKKKDYWGLLADAGEAVACAAAQILADGFDVCGIIKDIIETAKALGSAAEAVGKFFADLGSSLAGLAGDVACAISSLWGGCSSKPPPPSSNAVAWQQYYFPRVQNGEGLAKRLSSPQTWHAYAGQSDTDASAPIIAAGVQAKMPKDGMINALPVFWAAVYKQWDGKIGGDLLPKSNQAADQFKLPAKINQYVEQGKAAWSLGAAAGPKITGVYMESLLAPGTSACRSAIESAGAKQVDDWVDEGRIQKSGLSGLTWPTTYPMLCDPFRKQLLDALTPWAGQKAIDSSSCTPTNDGTGNYNCGSYNLWRFCANGMATLGLPSKRCINNGPGFGELPKVTYMCNGICKRYEVDKQPKGCVKLDIKDAKTLCSNMEPDGPDPKTTQKIIQAPPPFSALPSSSQDMSSGKSSSGTGMGNSHPITLQPMQPAPSAPIVVPASPARER